MRLQERIHLTRRQLFDAAGVQSFERIVHPDAGDRAVRRDFGERHQDERALEQTRMRQRQVGDRSTDIVIGEDIDVDRPRSPAPFARPVATERAFDSKCARSRSCGASDVVTAMTALMNGG